MRAIAGLAVLFIVRCIELSLVLLLVFRPFLCISVVFGRDLAKRTDDRLIEMELSDISLFKVIGWFIPLKLRIELVFVMFVRLYVI